MSFSQDEYPPGDWTNYLESSQWCGVSLEPATLPTKSFCDGESINNCMNYLSKELTALGLPPLYKNGSVQCDNVKLINAIYSLLGRIANERSSTEELQERILRLSSDLDTQRSQLHRLQERWEASEKGSQGHREKHRQVALKNKTLQADLKVERDECRRLQSVLQQRDAQFHHELRRKEQELRQLKERLLKAMDRRAPHQAPSITLSSGIPRTDRQRGTWSTKAAVNKNEEDLQKRIISGYEQRNQRLVEEIISLRETLVTLGSEAKSLLQDEDPDDHCELQAGLSRLRVLSGPNVQETVLETWRMFRSRRQLAQRQRSLEEKSCLLKQQSDPNENLVLESTKNMDACSTDVEHPVLPGKGNDQRENNPTPVDNVPVTLVKEPTETVAASLRAETFSWQNFLDTEGSPAFDSPSGTSSIFGSNNSIETSCQENLMHQPHQSGRWGTDGL